MTLFGTRETFLIYLLFIKNFVIYLSCNFGNEIALCEHVLFTKRNKKLIHIFKQYTFYVYFCNKYYCYYKSTGLTGCIEHDELEMLSISILKIKSK